MDIHNFEKRLERTLEKVKDSDISEQNKQDIIEFHNYCFSTGIGHAKIQRYLFDLEKLAHFTDKKFTECNKKAIEKLIKI